MMIGKISLTKDKLKKFCKKNDYTVLTTKKKLIFQNIEPIDIAGKNDITFCRFNNKKGINWSQKTKASLIFLPKEFIKIEKTINVDTKVFCDYPRLALLKLIEDFWENPRIKFVHRAECNIDVTAKLGENVSIGPYCVIGKNVKIGDDSDIGANTVIEHAIIGKNCKIGSNVTIGGEGFGFEEVDKTNETKTFPHIGIVEIGDNVRIGSSTCIDRASVGKTIVSDNVKIDNLVHISHNVIIGKNTKIVAMSIIGGSTRIGENTWVAPGSSVRDWTEIGNNVLVGLGAVITKNIGNNLAVIGNPARPIKKTNDRYRG